MFSKNSLKLYATVLAVVAVAAFVQRRMMTIPVIGDYLPR